MQRFPFQEPNRSEAMDAATNRRVKLPPLEVRSEAESTHQESMLSNNSTVSQELMSTSVSPDSMNEMEKAVNNLSSNKAEEGDDSLSESWETKNKTRRKNMCESQRDSEWVTIEVMKESKWVINPNTEFMKRWDMFVTLLLMYTASITPFSVAFGGDENGGFLWIMDKLVDFGFFIVITFSSLASSNFSQDMLINFDLGFKDESNAYIAQHIPIILKYLKWGILFYWLLSLNSFTGAGFFWILFPSFRLT